MQYLALELVYLSYPPLLEEARDINEAIQLASHIPPARYSSIEIRPVRELQQTGNIAGGQGD